MGTGRLTEPLLTQLVHETRLKRVMVLGISGTMEGWNEARQRREQKFEDRPATLWPD